MKTIYILLLPVVLIAGACNTNKNSMNSSDNEKQPVFSTASEAVSQAKSDLLEILRGDSPVNLGIEASAVESAEAGQGIDYYLLDFDKIMQAGDSVPLSQFIREQKSSVVPLMGTNVVTVIEIGEISDGWKILGLTDQKLTSDINRILGSAGKSAANSLVIYEIPNLNGNIYEVPTPNGTAYYTGYSSQFDLNQAISIDQLLPVLREDAIRFNDEYGDSLKDGLLK